MSEEEPQLKRDSTMVVTAREGEAFLEGCGKLDEDAKTRGQQKVIDSFNEEVPPSKMKRATTMEVTASEGADLLGGEELGKTRSDTAQEKEIESEENGAENENGDAEKDEEKPSLKRDGTMQVTAEEGAKFLEQQGHLTDARTRAEAAAETKNGDEKSEEKVDKNGQEEPEEKEEKPSLKRTHTMAETLKEGEDFLKRQKTGDEEEDKTEETAVDDDTKESASKDADTEDTAEDVVKLVSEDKVEESTGDKPEEEAKDSGEDIAA